MKDLKTKTIIKWMNQTSKREISFLNSEIVEALNHSVTKGNITEIKELARSFVSYYQRLNQDKNQYQMQINAYSNLALFAYIAVMSNCSKALNLKSKR